MTESALDGVTTGLVGSEAAFAVINEAWFQILAGESHVADLAAAPGCGTPALLDLLTGVELSGPERVLGATPTLRQSDVGNDAYGTSLMLQKEEWTRLMWGVRELWGPSQVLRKAVVAVGRDNRSLLAHVALAKDGADVPRTCRNAALLMLLQAAASLDRKGPMALLQRLPDGEEVVAIPEMKKLLDAMSPSTRCRKVPEGVLEAPNMRSSAEVCGKAPEPTVQVDKSSGCLVTPQDEAAVLAGLPTPPMRKIGSNISKGLLVPYQGEDLPGSGVARCCICLESFSKSELWHCGRESCGMKAFCSDCLRQHAEAVIDSGLYAAPAVRCPVCNGRLATVTWAPFVKEETFAKYHENARALLTYRCAACDETGSYLRTGDGPHGLPGNAGKYPFAMLGTEAQERLWRAWQEFFLAEVSAEKFLQAVLEEFSCGHRKGGAPPSSMGKVLGASGQANWIEDLERRLAMQLAWMNRFPRQRTLCCGEQFCFRCKVSSWHRGVTCNERLRTEKARQAQLCPGCGVPTQRSEGCRKITCVCGRVWEWEGNEGDESSDEEGAFSEDSGPEDDLQQAQTAVNLVAMNNKVPEETVKTLVQALVNAGADVNDWPSETRCPLLLAVQCRNTAAVAALCEVGARVTPEVLEELKAVSLESQRCEMERLMRPQVQGDPNMRLPLWVWIQAGSAAAVEALLRNAAHEEAVGEDVFIALQRSSGDDESRKQIAEHLREHVGEEQFQMMQTFSATRRFLMELRQALDEERNIEASVVQEAMANGADPNAREKEDEEESMGLTGLALIAMSYRSSSESVTSSIHALLEAKADLEIEVDDGATPLLVALRHRNMTALEVLAKATAEGSNDPAPRILTEILDEVGCLSEDSRRLRVEELLRPVLKAGGSARAPLPLWTWIENGSVAAVEALLRITETVCVEDVISLQRCRQLQPREQIEDLLKRKCGEEEFLRLETEAATRRLLQELREAFDDQRDVKLSTLQNSLDLGADANAQEEEAEEAAEFHEGSYSLSALQLLVTNLHVTQETMQEAVRCLVEAKADVNSELSETPLLSALQSRCVYGLRALSEHGARVSSDVLDELKTISSCKVRSALEDILQPLIVKDKRLRCPLWIWVQLGAVQACEAMVRNASHDEEIDVDVLVALQRCRGPTEDKEEISNLLQDHLGDEEFKRLEAAAATRRLLLELREAHTEEREPELDLILEALAQGANPNAQEEDEEETDEEDAEDEEEEGDGSMEEDEVGQSDSDKAAEMFEEDDREDNETEPEGEWDEES